MQTVNRMAHYSFLSFLCFQVIRGWDQGILGGGDMPPMKAGENFKEKLVQIVAWLVVNLVGIRFGGLVSMATLIGR